MALIGRGSTPYEPWGENPFPEGTPAHRSWTETNLWTKEHLALFQAEMLESRPSEEASPKEFLDHGLKVLAGQFDIWARAFSRSIVPTDQAAGLYEQLLNELEQAMAANATRFTASFLPEGLYTTEVRRLLLQRKQYWLGRMLRKVRKRKEANCAKAAANGVTVWSRPKRNGESLLSPPPIVWNLELHRAPSVDRNQTSKPPGGWQRSSRELREKTNGALSWTIFALNSMKAPSRAQRLGRRAATVIGSTL